MSLELLPLVQPGTEGGSQCQPAQIPLYCTNCKTINLSRTILINIVLYNGIFVLPAILLKVASTVSYIQLFIS